MMRIEILRETSISGRPVRVGEVVEVSDSDGRLLIGMKKAQPAPEVLFCPPRKPSTKRRKTNDSQSGDQNNGSEPAAE